MPVTEKSLALQYALTLRVADLEDAATRILVARWARAWQEISAEWESVIDEIIAARTSGQPLTPTQALNLRRAQRALSITADKLVELAGDVSLTLSGPARQVVADTIRDTAGILGAQLPGGAGISFARVDPAALEAIVARTLEQITALTYPLADDAYAAVQTALIRAIPSGWHPERAAREMLKRTRTAFNGGLTRALTIARTEILDAHRAASQAFEEANADIVDGWVWVAELDTRTCIACLAMHGTEADTADAMPAHQNCRCARAPKTKTWEDLGFNIKEPPSVLDDAETWFNHLDDADQIDIMGARRWTAWKNGTAAFADMATMRTNDGWRDSITVTPLNQLGA